MTRFDRYRAFTMREEGGYSSDRNDTGNWLGHRFIGCYAGVTAGALLRCLGDDHKLTITAAYMRHLPDADAAAVYLSYWQGMGCEALPPGVNLAVYDMGFNAGENRSVRLLQQCLGFPIKGDPSTAVDGMCGKGTARRAALADPRELIHDLHDAQALYYGGLAQFGRYGAVWLARTTRRRDAALAFASETA